jgi:hypothetical protein
MPGASIPGAVRNLHTLFQPNPWSDFPPVVRLKGAHAQLSVELAMEATKGLRRSPWKKALQAASETQTLYYIRGLVIRRSAQRK